MEVRVESLLKRSSILSLLCVVQVVGLCFSVSAVAKDPKALEEEARASENPLVDWKVFPLVLYTPETSALFVLGGLVSASNPENPDDGKPSTMFAVGVLTLKRQLLSNVKGDLFFANASENLQFFVSVAALPTRFFPIGNDSRLEDEEPLTIKGTNNNIAWLHRWSEFFFAGPQYYLIVSEHSEIDPDGVLAGGDRGSLVGSSEMRVSALGLKGRYDVRDHVVAPTSGGMLEASMLFSEVLFGSATRFSQFGLDGRYFISPWGPDHVLGLRMNGVLSGGDVPFNVMPFLGGQYANRGYIAKLYKDKSMLSLQGEYRMKAFWRLGVVGFAGIGQVMREPGEFGFERFHPSGGVGARVMLIKRSRLNLRADLGISSSGPNVYVGVQEAF